MPASYQGGNMRGSVSSPDTEPLTPDYDSKYYPRFFDSNLDLSQSLQSGFQDGGDHPLANSISQLLNCPRGIYTSSPNSASTPPLKNVFEYPNITDDLISNDEWPLGFNSSMHSFERANNIRRNDGMNMQSPPIHGPRAIRGSPPYSDCSSPSREPHALFGPARAITNTRSNSPAYGDPSLRELKNYLGPATEQELVNLQQLHALRHASSSGANSESSPAALTAAAITHRLLQFDNGPQLLTDLLTNLSIHQNQQQQSWPSSPAAQVDANGNEFNFSVLSSNGSTNGSTADKYGMCRNYFNGYNGGMAVNTEQARFEEAARYNRSALASVKQIGCPLYDGDFPIRENKNPTYSVKMHFAPDEELRQKLQQEAPHQERNASQTLSNKVFLGGVPWDITEENLMQDFSPFGRVSVQWPSGVKARPDAAGGAAELGADRDRKDSQKKGYVYVIFEADKQVKALLSACTQDLTKGPDTLFYPVSSKKFKLKMVQVIPWAICDSNHMKSSHMQLDPKCTVFVGALHGIMHAEFLFHVFDKLFQGVIFAGIDTDKFKYPIGSARVMFNNRKSYMRAVNAEFVEIKTPKFQKTVQVDPYLEDSPCSVCQHQQGPYFCKALSCFRYYCHNCWQWRHNQASASAAASAAAQQLATHQPLMRNSKTNTQTMSPGSAAAAFRHRVTSQSGSQQALNCAGGATGGNINNNNNNHWKYGSSAVRGGANADLVRGNLD